MAQEVLKPDIFWYDAPTKIDLPFNVVGLVLFELVTMHWCACHAFTPMLGWFMFSHQRIYIVWPLYSSHIFTSSPV